MNLAAQIKAEGEDCKLVILGKQAIDDDAGQTGPMLAGLLGWSQATAAFKVELKPDSVCVVSEVDGGLETVECSLPAVITCDLRLNEPRYATLPNIMKAKQKPLETKPADLEASLVGLQQLLQVEEPPKRKAGVMVGSVDELVSKLRDEAKVI